MNPYPYLIDCHYQQRICTSVIALTAICASFTTVLMAQPEITQQTDNSSKAHWQDSEVDVLLHHLVENRAAGGDGGNFSMPTYNSVVAAINADHAIQTIGPLKTAKMVKTKWTLLKKTFNQIEIYCGVSGFHWDNVRGAGIEGVAVASVCDAYVAPKSRIAMHPFCNKGWPPYNDMQAILGENSSAHGCHSFHPATAAPTFIAVDDVLDGPDGALDLLNMDIGGSVSGATPGGSQSTTLVVPLEWGPLGKGTGTLSTQREPPPRDKKGRFKKKTHKLEQEQEESEHEVIRQLADDEELLPGAPDLSLITFSFLNDESIEKESHEETQSLQFPPVEPPSPLREPWSPFVKPRATQAITPLHKPTSLFIAPIVTPPNITPTHTSRISNSTGPPAVFHGRSDKNAQNFLRATEMYILVNGIRDEAVKVKLLGTLISAGSQADLWWTNLDTKHKVSWTTIRAAFITKWPAIIAADKTKLDTLQKLVQDAGVDSAPILIQPVRDALPRTLRDLTSPAPPDWNTFLTEIKDVNIDTLLEKVKWMKERKEVEKAQNTRIARLENRQGDPVEILRLQMQQATIGTPVNQAAPYNTPHTQNPQPNPTFNNSAHRQIHYEQFNVLEANL
ncbi:uncharacterized protein F5891DRAFT_1172444 [Suillus fuscotomentosus]|uniref:Myb/SANT-like domain-containing protein n=1 Tax=Suillus fuscotomentosus TaxID=1912939 RepID=A0AAD4HL42_9AGAM|nr:uncharacterized protein F5891DRAFT_1172444 [Suillus fuscotomentosus]KAG1901665.1 hypothetical protein F5891DRAFT_1172444 [Suillus fuscotomentosus]